MRAHLLADQLAGRTVHDQEVAVAVIVGAYRRTRSLHRTAKEIGCGYSTLREWIVKYPNLRMAIVMVRDELYPPR